MMSREETDKFIFLVLYLQVEIWEEASFPLTWLAEEFKLVMSHMEDV